MTGGLSISVSIDWFSRKTDCSNCTECEQMIVSDIWELFYVIDGEKGKNPIEGATLCESCYLLNKNEP